MATERSILLALLMSAAVTCGGSLSSAPCAGFVKQFAAPTGQGMTHFDVHVGTAIVAPGCQPGTLPPICSTGWAEINVLLTPEANACPSRWLTGGSSTTDRDVLAVWLAFDVPTPLTTSSVIGTYVAKSDPWDVSYITGGVYPIQPTIVSVYMPNGTVPENGFPAVGANGTITITNFIDGQELAGTVDAQFGDGTHIVETFDVPFCTSACYSK